MVFSLIQKIVTSLARKPVEEDKDLKDAQLRLKRLECEIEIMRREYRDNR